MSATATAATDSGNIHDPTSAAYKKARRNHWKSTRNRPEHVDADWTPFRAAEKKYKARFPPPDLSEVLDIAAGDASRTEETSRGGWKGRADSVNYREIPLRDGPGQACGQRAYIFPGTPGAQPALCAIFELYVFMHLSPYVCDGQYTRFGAPPFLRPTYGAETARPMGSP